MCLVGELLDLIIQDQHKGTTHPSDHIGPGPLEEGPSSLIFEDLLPAVNCALVHNISCGNSNITINIHIMIQNAPVALTLKETCLLYVLTASSCDV